jgi:hypothetical protein
VSNPRPGPLCIVTTYGESGTRGRHGHGEHAASLPWEPPNRSSPIPNVLSKLNGFWTHQHISQRENSQPHSLWCGERHPRERRPTQQGRYSDGSPEDGGRAPVPADSRGARALNSGYSAKATGGYQQYGVQTAARRPVDQLRTGFNSSVRSLHSAHSLQVVTGGASPAVQLRAEAAYARCRKHRQHSSALRTPCCPPGACAELNPRCFGSTQAGGRARSDLVGIAGVGDTRLEGTAWVAPRSPGLAGQSGRGDTCSGRKVSSRRSRNADVLRDQERDHSTLRQARGAAPAAGGISQSTPGGRTRYPAPLHVSSGQTSTPPKSTIRCQRRHAHDHQRPPRHSISCAP